MTIQSNNDYLALPTSGGGVGVLVLHAWWGLTDFIRSFCNRLAKEGFVALAPDLFSGKVLRTITEAEQHLSEFDEAHDAPPKVLSALEDLSKRTEVTHKGLGVVGFSMGAYWALWLAQKRPDLIRAVTVFYGTSDGNFMESKAAFLGHFAEKDPYETTEGINILEKKLREAQRPVTFYTYPGTMHWFIENDRADAYHPMAAQLAWDRTVAFFHQYLDGKPG